MVKQVDELKDFIYRIFLAAGASKVNSETTAEHLISSNLCGVDTHGIWHVPGYIKEIQSGHILPKARPKIFKETINTALVSGNWTFGQVTAKYAMKIGISKAREHNLAIVGIVKVNHIGRLGEYAEMAADEGMISMICVGGLGDEDPFSVPYGGRQRLLGTNPIAMGFPSGQEPRMMFDFATTASSGVKIINAHREKRKVSPGWIVDREGNSTTNVDDFFSGGGAVPFGGHKGYAFMMAAEWMGRVFTGAGLQAEAGRGGPILGRQGVSMLVFRADLFQRLSDYAASADALRRRVRSIKPAPGFKEVLVPGDPEYRTRSARRRTGIPIPDGLWKELVELGESLEVEIEE